MELGPKEEQLGKVRNPLSFLLGMLLGCVGGFYYTLVPIYMYLKNAIWPKDWAM